MLFLVYGTMFLFGFLENIKGVSYPLIKNEFGVSYETQGTMISILSLGYTIFVIGSGFLLGIFKVKKVFLLSHVLLILGVSTIYFMPSFWTVALSLSFIFAGFGITEIAANGVATQIFIKRPALMMNLLHFMYGVGSIVGPKIAGILANPAGIGMSWRKIYFITVPMVMIIFIPMLFSKFPDSSANNAGADNAGNDKTGEETHSFLSALKTKDVWIFGLALGIMMGLEMISSNWGSLYFQDSYGLDPTTKGANFVSSFFILFTLSRLINGFIIEKIGYIRSLAGALLFCLVIYIAGFSLGASGIYILPVLGFFIAIFWPTLMAVAMGFFGKNAPIMTAAIIAIGGLINAGMQLSIGFINQRIGPSWGYRSCPLFTVIVVFLILKINSSMKKKNIVI